jgi:hypothetical protein
VGVIIQSEPRLSTKFSAKFSKCLRHLWGDSFNDGFDPWKSLYIDSLAQGIRVVFETTFPVLE